MQSVTVSRQIDKSPQSLRVAIQDIEPFMRAAGFDSVTVHGNSIDVSNTVGIAEIELSLQIFDDSDNALSYEQVDGIFKEMRTKYTVNGSAKTSRVTATTEFAIDIALIGDFLDATVIKRQRKHELIAQFDYLETTTGDSAV